MDLSVVIPALNDRESLARSLGSVKAAGGGAEIIMVDGGSRDGTAELAAAMGARVLASPPGRARQMNLGAGAARGDTLLFLHADTGLPPCSAASIGHALARPGIVAGAFTLRIDASRRALRVIERLARWRSRWLQMPYGDQGLFLRADTFHRLGGFPDIPIMEDFVLARRLRRAGRIAILPIPALTSARRWVERGVVRTTIINQLMILGYWAGVPPSRLATLYRGRTG